MKGINLRKVVSLIQGGLCTDGAHHKQWYLEQIAKALKIKLAGNWEEGIPN